MISLKSFREVDAVEEAGTALAVMHSGFRKITKPGISSWKIGEFARKCFKAAGAKVEQIGSERYKYAACVSVNGEICHGFPRKKLVLEKDSLIKIDTIVSVGGVFSSSCWSYAVGEVSPEIQKLMDVIKRSLFMGINQCVPGNRIGDIDVMIQHHTRDKNGYGGVREFAGHGIQPAMHEDPMVLYYGEHGQGIYLRSGATITIGPTISTGIWETDTSDPGGWLTRTADGGWSRQYEHILVTTNDDSKILTSQDPGADADYMCDDSYARYLDHYREIAEKVVKQFKN